MTVASRMVRSSGPSRAPVYSTLDGVCDSRPVVISGRTFCFTGQAKSGNRADLHRLVIDRGGFPAERVTPGLHYLVIGGLSNPAWAFATYGRKVQAVIDARKRGWETLIVREQDFLMAAGSPVGQPSA